MPLLFTDPQARQSQVLANGPRLEPLRADEMDEAALALNERVRVVANRDLEPKTLDTLPQFFGTVLRHPELADIHTSFGLHLLAKSSFSMRDRELIILRTGWLCGAPYEFGEHVHMAADAGIGAEEIAAIKIGSTAPYWSRYDRALLAAVEELDSNVMISDATWAILAETYGERQLIELPVLAGHYRTMAYLLNSLRMRLHEGNDGLMSR